MDIQTIPTEELEKDLQDSKEDICLCEEALLIGVTDYSGGPVIRRLNANKEFVRIITAELTRRQGEERKRNET